MTQKRRCGSRHSRKGCKVSVGQLGAISTWIIVGPRAMPTAFVYTTDPVGGGQVASLARPGGNATGFVNYEFGLGAKWLELLKQLAPRLTRVAVLRDPT